MFGNHISYGFKDVDGPTRWLSFPLLLKRGRKEKHMKVCMALFHLDAIACQDVKRQDKEGWDHSMQVKTPPQNKHDPNENL